jgi:hypothetical protein
VAAELHDMIQEDLRKIYPDLMKDVTIRLIELQARKPNLASTLLMAREHSWERCGRILLSAGSPQSSAGAAGL